MMFDESKLPRCIACGKKTMGMDCQDSDSHAPICPRCMVTVLERMGPRPVIEGTDDTDWTECNRRFLEELKKLAEENGMLPEKTDSVDGA